MESFVYNYIASFSEGWAIPRSDLDMKSALGKGEFGGNAIVQVHSLTIIVLAFFLSLSFRGLVR